jgi:hypothetical protein
MAAGDQRRHETLSGARRWRGEGHRCREYLLIMILLKEVLRGNDSHILRVIGEPI